MNDPYVGTFRDATGSTRTVIVLTGRKKLTLIGIDSVVRLDRVELSESRYIHPKPYPVRRTARTMLGVCARLGCHKHARKLLRALAKGVQ